MENKFRLTLLLFASFSITYISIFKKIINSSLEFTFLTLLKKIKAMLQENFKNCVKMGGQCNKNEIQKAICNFKISQKNVKNL